MAREISISQHDTLLKEYYWRPSYIFGKNSVKFDEKNIVK